MNKSLVGPLWHAATERLKAADRIHKYRLERRRGLDDLGNESVRRIAIELDYIKDDQDYVIVDNVLPPSFDMSMIAVLGEVMPITFTNSEPPYTRTMQAIDNPHAYLSDVFSALKHVFSGCVHIVVKLLKSVPGDPEQLTHVDFDTILEPSFMKLSEFNYSAIISLEDNTRLLVGDNKKSISIPIHSMILFRGNMPHAGAKYSTYNTRIFISASCEKFPVTDDVFIVR